MLALLALPLSFAEEAEPPPPLLEVELADIKIKRQEPIPIPDEAREIELPSVTCSMRVFIDPKGLTESVTVAGCPDEFHQAVNDSVMQWRFKPVKTPERQPARATFLMAVTLDLWADRSPEPDGEELE